MSWKDDPIVGESSPSASAKPTGGRVHVPEGYNGGNLLYNDTGVGRGVLNLGRSAVNIMLPKSMEPSWATDEAVKQARKETRDKFGFVGPFVGEQMAMAPLALVGKGAQAAGAATNFPKLMSFLGALTEGGVSGALSADPGERDKGAMFGAGSSGVVRGLGMAGGKAAEGLVEKSDEAKALIQQADLHGVDLELPLGEAAKPGLIKSLYRNVLTNIPLAGGALEKQGDDAARTVRELAIREGLPMGESLPANAGDDVLGAVKKIGGEDGMFDKAYNSTVKGYVMRVPGDEDLAARITARVKEKMPNVNSSSLQNAIDEITADMKKFASGESTIDGGNLLNVKNSISAKVSKLFADGKTRVDADALKNGKQVIEDIIIDELTPMNTKAKDALQALADLNRYKSLNDSYSNFSAVKEAAEGSKVAKGQFSFDALAKAAPDKGPLLKLSQDASSVLDRGVGSSSLPGRYASIAALGLATGLGSPGTAAAVLGGSRLLATKGAQRTLMGDTALQKQIVKQLRENPELYRILESTTRRAAASAAGSP